MMYVFMIIRIGFVVISNKNIIYYFYLLFMLSYNLENIYLMYMYDVWIFFKNLDCKKKGCF